MPSARAWTVKTLNACAPPASLLRDLLAAYASEPGGLRAFGHFLARAEGIVCVGHRLRRVGEDRGGALYLVERVRVLTPAKPASTLVLPREAAHHLPVRILRSQP